MAGITEILREEGAGSGTHWEKYQKKYEAKKRLENPLAPCASPTGRDEKGRLLPGHQANLGHKGGTGGRFPAHRMTTSLVDLMDSVITECHWTMIFTTALEQALDGDARAREWLADRRFGKAKEAIDITSDGERIESLTDAQLVAIVTDRRELPPAEDVIDGQAFTLLPEVAQTIS